MTDDLERTDPSGAAGAWNAPFPMPGETLDTDVIAWLRAVRDNPDNTFDIVHGAAATFPTLRVMDRALQAETNPARRYILRTALDLAYAVNDHDHNTYKTGGGRPSGSTYWTDPDELDFTTGRRIGDL